MQTDASADVIRHADGRVELSRYDIIESSPLYNHDLAPVPVAKRNWSTYNFAALWTAMAACITTYQLSSGLITQGMNWWQALLTILLGNTIVLIPILANSHPGTKYGIPFPVLARASYGTIGSNMPALMRALVACGWFGIQAWIGGTALQVLINKIHPAWQTALPGSLDGHSTTEWISFALFWGLNILVIYRGMDILKKVESLAAPFVMTMTVALLIWAITQAHGIGTLLHQPDKFANMSEFWPVFIPSLTGMIGYWATLSLNMPDFTRFGRSQKEQVIGQVVALPSAMTIFCACSIIITSAAIIIFPQAPLSKLWNPVELIGLFQDPFIVGIAMFTVCIATLSVNVAANVVSPANDFANAFPKWISFSRGGLITGILGIAFRPWLIIADPHAYIVSWLVGYSGGLGAIAGVMIADYWVIRKKELVLQDLYLAQGAYTYTHGWNWRAVAATLAGCAIAWIGLVVPALNGLVQYGWFVGFAVSFVSYYLFTRASPAPAIISESAPTSVSDQAQDKENQ